MNAESARTARVSWLAAAVAATVFLAFAGATEQSPGEATRGNAAASSPGGPSITWDSQSGRAVLTNGRLELIVDTKPGLSARSLRDLKSGQVYADRDYFWSGGELPKPQSAPVITDHQDGSRSIVFSGQLGTILVEQAFTLATDEPGVILEEITIRNPTSAVADTSGFKCGFVKCIRQGETWLPDAAGFRLCPVPYRRETNGQLQEFPLREVAEHDTAFAGWAEPEQRTPIWGAEGWVWSKGSASLLVAKYNPDSMEWSLMEPLRQGAETAIRFGGAGMWKHGHPEPAAQLAPGATYRFGQTRLQVVDGDWKQAYYAYRGWLEGKGCKTPPDYNPPVHWNELYDNQYYPRACALGAQYFGPGGRGFCPEYYEKNKRLLDEYYSLDLMKGEADKAKESGCEALYLDPGWDTGMSQQVWDAQRLGSMESFVKMMREDYGLKVSLWCSLAGVPPTIGDPSVCPPQARVINKDGKPADLLLCLASPAFLDTKQKRLLELCRNGAAFLMFDSTQFSGPCYDTTHGHQVPSTREDHARALLELTRRVKRQYPHVLIEMHDFITGPCGIHYTPTYYGYAQPHSFDCLWGHEFMWNSLRDLLSGRAISLYYYNLAYSIPLYLHISLQQENENALLFWWYASTCRHLGMGGKPADAAWEADKLAMKTYLSLKRFYTQGVFYGLDETVHAHTLPDLGESVINVFNLQDKPTEKRLQFRLHEIGLPAGPVEIEGAESQQQGDQVDLSLAIPAHGHRLLKVKKPPRAAADPPTPSTVLSLSGDAWLLAPDPQNVGQKQKWWEAPRPEAKPTKVPWIIQDAFPGYHGVAWYWRDFTAPANPHRHGRFLLRFWQVDYLADVWLNGVPLGRHEGGESPFLLDVTAALKPGATNRLAVRVLNPTHQPIDGIVLGETAHRNKVLPYGPGSAWDQGGIMDDVELLATPPVRVADLFVRPDWQTGLLRIQATIDNASQPVAGHIEFSIAPAATGETILCGQVDRRLPAGQTLVETQLKVENHRLWELKDPFLYRLTARVSSDGADSFDEQSVRFGFRDFRVANGAFRLNGKRIFVRSSHTGNCCPIGLELPHDPDFLRRDLVNAKFMGFNMIRFIAGVAKRYQLDLCDELGLMVYEESYAGWCMRYSPKFAQRYDESVLGMIRRDRNHPSLVIWGLLNETTDGPVFRHAVGFLPALRALDDTRLVMLDSGQWYVSEGVAGVAVWRNPDRPDPCATFNATKHVIKALGITWLPGQLALHPGRDGEYAVARWTAPKDEQVDLSVVFTSIAERATTDVHVLHGGKPLFDGGINVNGAGPEQTFHATLPVRAGDTLDCVCGYGNGNYGADTTAVAVTVKTAGGKTYDAAADFSTQRPANSPWSFGQMAPGPAPQAKSFVPFPTCRAEEQLGCASNPGSAVWQSLLEDRHPYQRVPHTAEIIHTLRSIGSEGGLPMFVSEYGIGSACDLLRLVRLYEQAGKPDVEDAQLYRTYRDLFLADWQRWKMCEAFDRPEDFFAQSNARMAGGRLLGLNALRSNPHLIGYSLTGTLDQGMTGEGLWTTFRELKPGTADAVFDGLAPLRWCLFAEPVNVYRNTPVRLEAVLANEDVLPSGEYPVRLQVVGPEMNRPFEKTLTVKIPASTAEQEPPLVLPVFAEDVVIDAPTGKYRFSATFQRGAAAAGESVDFYIDDPALMPPVEATVTLWGDDPELAKWLAEHGIHTCPFSAALPQRREVILACGRPPDAGEATAAEAATKEAATGRAAAFRALAQHIARGSTAVFLSPEVFAQGDNRVAWLPLKNKGSLAELPSWLYHQDQWCKRHPIFAGLPAPGLMDYTFYRELIPDTVFVGQDPPQEAVAGAINAAQGYSSGLLLAVYPLGAGEFVLNTLNVRQNLGSHPAAERLLRNILRYAARHAAQPLAELPPDFDAQLKALGYLP